MDFKKKIVAIILISQLAVMQIGLNIFFSNCCCKKTISQSIYPSIDLCTNKANITSCCKPKYTSGKEQGCSKKACGKNQIKYSKGGDQALNASVENFNFSYTYICHQVFPYLIITPSTTTILYYIKDRAPPISGKIIRIIHCSFLC